MMALLFYSSSQPYESQSMTGTLESILAKEPLKELLSSIRFTYAGSEISIHTLGYSAFIEFFIRKAAHFSSYFLLALFWLLGLKDKMKGIAFPGLLSWLLATGYASFDEFHQGLTPDRTPLLQDIILDTVGALTAIFLIVFFLNTRKPKRRKR